MPATLSGDLGAVTDHDRRLTFVCGVLVGVCLTIGVVGWWGEHRLLVAERASSDRWASRVGTSYAVMDAALEYALPNRVERGLAWAHAVSAQMSKKDPAIRDDGPTIKRGR